MKVNEPKRHHVNPQLLLREFADARRRVLVVPKNGGSSRRQRILNVSVVRNANTMQTSAGPDDSLERLLSQIEGHFPDALRILDLQNRTPEQDALVLSMVATQAARDPYVRSDFFGREILAINGALRHALHNHKPAFSEAEIEEKIDYYAHQNFVKPHLAPTCDNIAIAGTAWLIMKMYEDFAHYRLTVIHSARSAYITADSPASIFPESAQDREEATFTSVTEFVLPVTPRHAILITDHNALPQWTSVELSVEMAVNARTAKRRCESFIARHTIPPTYSRGIALVGGPLCRCCG